MAGKQDLRVKKTKRALVLAMNTLLETQSFGKITVNDLCTEAMISRSAFYTHFEDKYSLLNYYLESFVQQIFEKSQHKDLREQMHILLEGILENNKIFRNLLLSELDIEIAEMIRRIFHRDFECLLQVCMSGVNTLPKPLEIASIYYSAGISGAILYWISKDAVCSIDEMTDCLCALLPLENLTACLD